MTEKPDPPSPTKTPWSEFGKSAVRALLHKFGGLHDVRQWNRDGIRILMYHDFPASAAGLPEALAKQCAHIARYYQVLSLTDIARFLRAGKRLPQNAVAVTVDDGNRDFLISGYPVFHAYRIPVTVFLVSGFLDRHFWLWWDQINYAVGLSRRTSFQMPLSPGQPPSRFIIETPEQRGQAISTITKAMKNLPPEERRQVLNSSLSAALDVKIPREPPADMAPLGWPEVRRLAEDGVDFGAHTVTHPLLSSIRDSQELHREVGDSKRRIEEELHRPVLHFCYPYGHWDDFNDQTLNVLDECKFQTAVTAQHGLNFRHTDPFKLLRLSIDPLLPELYFQERLAGLHSG